MRGVNNDKSEGLKKKKKKKNYNVRHNNFYIQHNINMAHHRSDYKVTREHVSNRISSMSTVHEAIYTQ